MAIPTRAHNGKLLIQPRETACSRFDLQSAQLRIRQAAQKDKGLRFTALWHHVYNIDCLRDAYLSIKRHAAPGVDEQSWQQYGEDLEVNLQDLSVLLQRGAYQAKPVLRTYVPKADGSQRPIGIPVLEDKIVQRAAVRILNNVYEIDFKGFSYGFRPGRSQHNALDALSVGITEVGKWLRSVLLGHYRYYGVTCNSRRLSAFRYHLLCYWKWTLRRRSQRQRTIWERMSLIATRWSSRHRNQIRPWDRSATPVLAPAA
jgi:Reverse transcriptase (RNA-dependent DNA polymerase)